MCVNDRANMCRTCYGARGVVGRFKETTCVDMSEMTDEDAKEMYEYIEKTTAEGVADRLRRNGLLKTCIQYHVLRETSVRHV